MNDLQRSQAGCIGVQEWGVILARALSQGLKLTLLGLALGGLGALALGRALQSFLFEVRASDPATFAAIAVMLFLVAGLASFLPAYRAARVDPLHSLRYE